MFATETRWKWVVVGVLLAVFAPLWAFFELDVAAKTFTGLLILAAGGPAFVALVTAMDAGLQWSGRQEVLGSLEFSAVRLVISMVAAVAIVAVLVLFGRSLVESGPVVSAARRFLAANFRWSV
jgi:hypothetical protein